MLRKETTPQTVSEQEAAAQLAEIRKSTAESDCVVLSDNKKKLENDILNLKDEIKTNNDLLDKTKLEVVSIKSQLLDAQNSLDKQISLTKKAIEDRNIIEKELEDFKIKSELEKNNIKNNINDLSLSHSTQKSQKENEIKFLEQSKQPILDEIKVLISDIEVFKKQHEDELSKIEDVKPIIKTLINNKDSIEKDIEKLNNQILDLNTLISKSKIELDSTISSIENKQKEILDLDVSIEKKKVEYTNIEKQAFIILNKQQILDNKEAFIKSQYERAGIKWE